MTSSSPVAAMAENLLTSMTWSQKDTDFTVAFPSTSRTLRCHKSVLAKNSPVLKTMLNLECLETSTSQMTMVDFDYDTTVKFLSCLYSDSNAKTRRSRARLTPQVLKMAHFYAVKKLQDDCVECLKGNISKDNVVEVWMVAEMIEDESLREAAFMYFFSHPRDEDLLEIPGMNEACVNSLVDFLLCHSDLYKMARIQFVKDTMRRPLVRRREMEYVTAFRDWLNKIKAAEPMDHQETPPEETTNQLIIPEPAFAAAQQSIVTDVEADFVKGNEIEKSVQ